MAVTGYNHVSDACAIQSSGDSEEGHNQQSTTDCDSNSRHKRVYEGGNEAR